MNGSTCAGLWVTGIGKDGQPREVYLYHVVDNDTTMFEYGAQCVVWQTAVNPVVALELLANGTWSGAGVLGPEAFDAQPFLDLLAGGYASPWGMEERTPPAGRAIADADLEPAALINNPAWPSSVAVDQGCGKVGR